MIDLAHRGRKAGDHRRLEEAGRDGDHADAERREVTRDRQGEPDDAGSLLAL